MSLFEDLLVIVVVVDIELKICFLVDDVIVMIDCGLVILEWVWLVIWYSGVEEFGDIDSWNGDVVKFIIYVGC